jgi:hypothetical protein
MVSCGFFYDWTQKSAARKRGGKPCDAKTCILKGIMFSGSCYGDLDPLVENDSKKVRCFFGDAKSTKKTAKGKEEGNLSP